MGTPLPMYGLPPSEPPAEIQQQPEYQRLVAGIRADLATVRDLPGLAEFTRTKSLPQEFFTHLNAALAKYDELIDYALAHDGAADRIRCTKGCANCCIDLVRGISTPEIINIYHHVRGWSDVRQLFEYHRASAEVFMEILSSKLKPGERGFGGDDPRVVASHVEYNARRRPCGFLDQESGLCRIYPVRPIACRYFFSFDPPEMCTPTHEQYLQRRTRTIHLPLEVNRLLSEIGHKLGFRPLNYLAGAFCGFAAEVMRTQPIQVTDDGGGTTV